jgi:hypothetical protein
MNHFVRMPQSSRHTGQLAPERAIQVGKRTRHAFKTGFRPGRSGACEARLFQFTGPADGAGEPPVKRVAACDLHEAIAYMRKWHPGLDILRVELVALIEMVSGSPLN